MTTLETLQSGSGSYQVVVAIEGLQYLITDGSTSAALTAWNSTEWTQAIGGLQVNWRMRQKLEPWSSFVDASQMSIGIQDSTDVLGPLMFATTAGDETLLAAAVDAKQQAITVKSTADFASSGSIHIGTEHITYTSKTSTQFLGCERGMYAPFRANSTNRRSVAVGARRFGRAHPLPAVGDGYVVSTRVTSQQRTWIGRWVGIWLHARSGSTLDTLPNAQLIFAGKIASFRDEANGMIYVELESCLSSIRDTVLLRDQWTAKVAQGIYLKPGDTFKAWDYEGSSKLTANNLVVVESGASGTNEIDAGIYSLDEVAAALNTWLTAEKNAGTPRLNFRWTFSPIASTGGHIRSKFSWSDGAAGSRCFAHLVAPKDVLEFLGWVQSAAGDETEQVVQIGHIESGTFFVEYQRFSNYTPMLSFIRGDADNLLYVEDVRGTWWDNKQYMQVGYGIPRNSTDSYALIQFGEDGQSVFLCKEETAGSSIRVVNSGSDLILNGQLATADPIASLRKVYVGEDTSDIPLKQIAQIRGTLASVLTEILASTGTRGYNHATYDKLPEQLSVAIPWQILGTNWVKTAEHIAESGSDLIIQIEKPTKFSELFLGELVARMAFFVWKNECIRLATWSVPASVTASHSLTEANKATPIDAKDDQRTVANETDDYLTNAIKLLHRRGLDGKFHGTINIIDKSSQYDIGVSRPVTIELRNIHHDPQSALAKKIADSLASMMGILSSPLRVIRRTIAMSKFENMAPGDICLVSDDFVRDPSTGTRGITNRAALVLSHEFDFGGYEIDTGRVRPPMGQVDLLLWPREKVVAHSPTAQVDNTAANGGYNAGTLALTVLEHEHSLATDAVDASHFTAGDAVRVIEIDPDDPTNPTTWTDTVASVSGNTITLTTGLAGWSSSLRYRVIAGGYASAVTAQRSKAFQATSDHLVVDMVTAYEYGHNPTAVEGYRDTGNELPALYAQAAYGDGVPLDVGYERDAARLVNNLIRWRTAPMMPALTDTEKIANDIVLPSGSLVRGMLAIEPVAFHPTIAGDDPPQIAVRAWARTSSARSSLRITLARRAPYGTGFYCIDETSPVYGWEQPAQTETVELTSTTWGATQMMLFEAAIVDPVHGEAFFIIEGGPDAEYMGLCMCQLVPGGVRPEPLSWKATFPDQVPRRKVRRIEGGVSYVRLP